jgi:hypothetical protein
MLLIVLDGILESGNRIKNWRMGIKLKKEGCIFVFCFCLLKNLVSYFCWMAF